MALRKEKEEAIKLRLQGQSYSQIKITLGIGKGTLSSWLAQYPLSEERIRELRDFNPQRIERYRNTMRIKRENEMSEVLSSMSTRLGSLTAREVLIAGIFLYWAEGTKSIHARTTTALANTDPAMLRFFIKWLEIFDIKVDDLRIKLHLYADMDVEKEIKFWSKQLKVPKTAFTKPYIKKSRMCDITYRNGFGHGTCNIQFFGKQVSYQVLMGVRYFREMYGL
jgi:hypothetical protein